MKHCPKCKFSFPEFHRACHFDGAELVEDPEPRALIKVGTPPRPSRFRRALDSSTFWTCLLVIALLSSVFVVAYYDAVHRSTPVVRDQASPPSLSVARAPELPPAVIKTTVAERPSSRSLNTLPKSFSERFSSFRLSSSARLRRATDLGSMAWLHQKKFTESRVLSESRVDRGPRTDIPRGIVDAPGSRSYVVEGTGSRIYARAGKFGPQQLSDKKEPGKKGPNLVAMLKTTWHVLKRPFKF